MHKNGSLWMGSGSHIFLHHRLLRITRLEVLLANDHVALSENEYTAWWLTYPSEKI